MAIHIGVEHRTSYEFDRPIEIHPHVLRLRPAPHCRTPILGYTLDVEPADHFINWQQDPFGNHIARLVFNEPTDRLSFSVEVLADLTVINPFDFFVEDYAERFPFAYEPQLAEELAPYRAVATTGQGRLDEWVQSVAVPDAGMPIVDFLVALNSSLYRDVAYSVRMEPGVQSPDETFDRGIGSCRDTGWLLVEALRRLGLAARFVSGYLVQLRSDVRALDGPDGPAEDFTDLHAWAEVFVPGAGWVGLDPTSGLFAGEGHIPLACTPHPQSAAPISGATAPSNVEFAFSNVVHRVREDPRVTLPYSDQQWAAIDELGAEVDGRLDAGDVRLTMGGEPTFVSIDDMEGEAWNVAADSAEKRTLARELSLRLLDRFGRGGLIQHSQGKWYPGEPLPRWQMGLNWRIDGQPLWRNHDLLAHPPTEADAEEPADPALTPKRAKKMAEEIARHFDIESDLVVAAYEDPVDLAWREAQLPLGEPAADDVTKAELKAMRPDADDPDAARRALIERLGATAGRPVGFVVPLHPTESGDGWQTTRWHLRRKRLFLTPGDSPLGLRLPLDSLAWSKKPLVFERSPYEPRGELPPSGQRPKPAAVVPRHRTNPTAVSVEVRDNRLCIFLPPLEHAERAIELLAVVESVAAKFSQPVVLEGYPLPRDPRLGGLMVTPDPGVIEVNVQPSSSWDELKDVLDGVHAEARATRLGTEKYALDGTHTGTGGGNHVTLGGATPADSPLLRRPDLLRSLLTFWQHHPSLSYLFSGQFIGPTSQAPRVDEGRDENLYELEIAFAELDRAGPDASPWVVDRLLRHLLTDLTGNTHRAEFCIDKLYSPDSERGRLGILELRAFEMPPHPQMALVQALLVRSLVARFWDEPYQGDLVRWGTDLSDRFMLPWFVRADMADVVADLAAHGIDFQMSWLEPFLEFRFPLIGEVELDAVGLELRSAIEPWHVLGEEVSSGGTARYVDSSVERLQVMVRGFNPARHIVTVNGVPAPLQPTAVPGTAVAGVRFKAWAPWSALHPTIDVHAPLTVDLVDRWNQRSLGGCVYHVVHPGGRSYDTFPVNAAEAESRRGSRFETVGHTAGAVNVAALDDRKVEAWGREYPRTLDLRRVPPPPST